MPGAPENLNEPSIRVPRYALINATHNAVKNKAKFKVCYEKKCGKIGHIAIHLNTVLANFSGLFMPTD